MNHAAASTVHLSKKDDSSNKNQHLPLNIEKAPVVEPKVHVADEDNNQVSRPILPGPMSLPAVDTGLPSTAEDLFEDVLSGLEVEDIIMENVFLTKSGTHDKTVLNYIADRIGGKVGEIVSKKSGAAQKQCYKCMCA